MPSVRPPSRVEPLRVGVGYPVGVLSDTPYRRRDTHAISRPYHGKSTRCAEIGELVIKSSILSRPNFGLGTSFTKVCEFRKAFTQISECFIARSFQFFHYSSPLCNRPYYWGGLPMGYNFRFPFQNFENIRFLPISP